MSVGLGEGEEGGVERNAIFKPDAKEGVWDAGVSGRGKFRDEGGGGGRMVGYAGDGVGEG